MPAAEAQKVMVESKIRHLPVVGDGKRPEGLLTRQRLRIPPADLGSLNVWEITRYLSELKVKDLMVGPKDLVTIEPNATVEHAAQTMAEHRYGCLPVVEDNIVVGIITETDLLVQLAELLGGFVPGARVTARMPGKIGGYAAVMAAVAERGWGMYATGSVPAPKREGYWDIVLKIRDVPASEIVSALEEVEDCKIIDVRET
jgi:acetoin utilization protein AcuB